MHECLRKNITSAARGWQDLTSSSFILVLGRAPDTFTVIHGGYHAMFSKPSIFSRRSSRQKAQNSIQSEGSASITHPPQTAANTYQALGLEVVFEGNDPIVDIVAVHGLNGHRQKTWTADNSVNWLRHLLPADVPRARIMCWGYDANTHDGSRVSCQYLYDHARTLVSDLSRKRSLDRSTRRPIIFVAHSLGGIIVKSALIHSDASRQGALPEHRSIKLSTYGIIFMGTPHQGGNGVQLGLLLANIASVFIAADDRILRHLKRDSEWLQQQLGQYGPISNEFVTKFAYEEYMTPTALGHKIMIVPRASAVVPGQTDAEPIIIHADHLHMVKFPSKDDTGYRAISEHLQIMMVDVEDKIRLRWEEEERVIEARNDVTSSKWFLQLSLSDAIGVTHFVAREEELTQLHDTLRNGDTGRQTAILQGLGGIGKTQLAVAYIKRYYKDYSAVIWLNARDEASLKQTFAHAAERILRQYPSIAYIQNAMRNRDLDQMTQAVRQWLGEFHNNRWLVIYDNYDEPRFSSSTSRMESSKDGIRDGGVPEPETPILTAKGFDIRPFFPDSYQGTIIITTRSSAVKFGEVIRLGKLRNIRDSLQILASTSHRQGLEDDNAALELARRLDGLPLALSTAGSYLDQVSTSCAEYLELNETSWLRLQEATPQLPTYDYAMYSTWDISYRHIKREDKKAANLLKLWAYFDNEDLWFELLQSGRLESEGWMLDLTHDRLSFDKTMRVLCRHGLAEVDSTREWGAQSSGYSVHGCVHSWMVHVLNRETNEDMSQLAMTCVASHRPDDTVAESWSIQRRLLRHADRCFVMINKYDGARGNGWIYANLARLYADQGRLIDAETMYKRALQGYEKACGPEHTSTLGIVNNLGTLYEAQGRFIDAEAIYNRALQGKEKAWGPDHTSTLDTVNNLGTLYQAQGRFIDAEAMYNRALEGYEKACGPDHTSTLNTVNNLGYLYKVQGQFIDAEAMYDRALQGYEKALSSPMVTCYPPALNTLENLGDLLDHIGRTAEAQTYYTRAEAGVRLVYGSGGERHREIISKLQPTLMH